MTRSWWGWGLEERHLDRAALDGFAAELARRLGGDRVEVRDPARVEDLDLPAPRLDPPPSVPCTTEPSERARHAHGQSFREVARAFRGELGAVPDVVALPRDAAEVTAVLDWCAEAGAACVTYGGGTSVVGGVEPPADRPVVSLDTRELAGVHEVDAVSRAARIGGGTTGPAIEAGLRAHRLTLRFYPQSWEFSTLGGWVATRAGGHYATRLTHVDDLVESVTAVTPAGLWESRRLPASGAGPSPDRLLLGSEGVLGVVTEAWVRLQDRPSFRAGASVTFRSFDDGLPALRALVQSGLDPANCRLLDPAEATLAGAAEETLLIVGFESGDHPVEPWRDRALELLADHGGRRREGGGDGGAAESWKQAFIAAPYVRDAVVACGAVAETFESAFTWDRLPGAVAAVTAAVRGAVGEPAHVAVRTTHAYPDGAAPYWTVVAPGPVERWDEVKEAASDAVLAAGGTITHHHAVGRHHRPWYDRQRPDPFAAALRAAKAAVDPAGVLNPGVLVDPA